MNAQALTRIINKLNKDGEAKTKDYQIALAYAQNANPYKTYEVKASHTGGWIIKVIK